MAAQRICSIDGCGKGHRALGYCRAHYNRQLRHGDPMGGRFPVRGAICKVEGCQKGGRLQAGMCSMHYSRKRIYGTIDGGDPNFRKVQRFLYETVMTHEGADCFDWPFAKNQSGYGTIKFDGRMQGVHRVVCMLHRGPPPTPEHEAAHSCGRGQFGCCNKKHIRWATAQENADDRRIHKVVPRGPAAYLHIDAALSQRQEQETPHDR